MKSQKDIFAGEVNIQEKQSEKYLGDLISVDGRNIKNITVRKNRGIGIVTEILSLLENLPLGKYYFQTVVILRNSLLLGSILLNCESWYNITQAEMYTLMYPDKMLLQKVFEVPKTVPTEMLFLELGIYPINFIIIQRRLAYFQHILKQKETSLVYQFIKTQYQHMKSKDWINQ